MTEVIKAPRHLWIVGGLSLLWNAFGGYDYVMTQSGNAAYLEMFTAEQRAFFDSFPIWMEASWAFGIWGAIAGSVLLLMRSRYALWAFAISLAGLAFSTLWQFGLSGADIGKIMGPPVIVMTLLIWVVAILLLYYAWRQVKNGVLE
jgi:hypothetical protein